MLNRSSEKSECDKCDSVATNQKRFDRETNLKSDVADRLERFATLVTRLDLTGVTSSSEGVHTCHTVHMQNSDVNENKHNDHATKVWLILSQWLEVIFDEGHIEPSQPSSGKLLGWPSIAVPIKALWIDFNCWFYRKNLSKELLIEEQEFFAILGKIFVRDRDRFCFPSLRTCNLRYKALKVMYECI